MLLCLSESSDHVHFLLYFNKEKQSLNTIIGNGKRFIGYEIIKRLKAQKQYVLLTFLSNAVDSAECKRNKQHEVWQGTFDGKECRTEAFILQKLNYMHFNPVLKDGNLQKNRMVMNIVLPHFIKAVNREKMKSEVIRISWRCCRKWKKRKERLEVMSPQPTHQKPRGETHRGRKG